MKKGIKQYIAGTLILTGLIGCEKPNPIDQLELLKQSRERQTYQNVYNFNEGLEKLQEKAVTGYTHYAKAQEKKDLKLIESARQEREKLRKLEEEFQKELEKIQKGVSF